MRSSIGCLGSIVALCVTTACGEVPAESEPAQRMAPAGDTVAAQERADTAVVDTSAGPGCIQGGTQRAEVLRIMGEPDSISFGAWLYGSSRVLFGYGVVVEIRNDGQNLVLCRPPSR